MMINMVKFPVDYLVTFFVVVDQVEGVMVRYIIRGKNIRMVVYKSQPSELHRKILLLKVQLIQMISPQNHHKHLL